LTQPLAQPGGGPPLQQLLRAPGVERRVPHLARSPLDKIDRANLACRRHQLLDDASDAARNPGPDVHRADRRGAQRSEVGIGHVRDEDEVPRLEAVATDLGPTVGQQPLARDGDHARLTAPILEWAVDVRIPKRQRAKAERSGEHPEVALGGQFRRPIGGQWFRRRSLGRRQSWCAAIDRPTRGGEDEPAAAGIGARFEHRYRPHHVDQRVSSRIANRSGYTTLGRQVEDRVGPKSGDRLRGCRTAEVGWLQLGLRWQRLTTGMAKVVDDEDHEAFTDQPADRVHADKACTAGHDDALRSIQR